jgi:hypothetical protein
LVEPGPSAKIYRTIELAKTPTYRDRSGILADPIRGTAVLEYGATEILPAVGAILKHPARLWRPRRQANRGGVPTVEIAVFSRLSQQGLSCR